MGDSVPRGTGDLSGRHPPGSRLARVGRRSAPALPLPVTAFIWTGFACLLHWYIIDPTFVHAAFVGWTFALGIWASRYTS